MRRYCQTLGLPQAPAESLRLPEREVQEKTPDGGLGVSPNFLFFFPQDWGVKGVEQRPSAGDCAPDGWYGRGEACPRCFGIANTHLPQAYSSQLQMTH